MSEFSSYYLYQKFEQRGEQEAIPVYPNVYSIDADGTRERVVKLDNDPQCGYEPQAIYRWTNIPIEEDSICEDCEVEPIYRWANLDPTTEYYCSGTTKFYKQTKQISFDNGETWKNWFDLFECYSYRMGEVAEECSEDCGCEFNGKWFATYQDGHTLSAECDSTSAITYGEITKNNLVRIEIGDCVTNIGGSAFINCGTLTEAIIPNSVTGISEYAFDGCGSLTNITCLAITPPALGRYALYGSVCPIYVPAQSVDAYKSAWSDSHYVYRIKPIS